MKKMPSSRQHTREAGTTRAPNFVHNVELATTIFFPNKPKYGNPDDEPLANDPDRKVHILIACLYKLCNMVHCVIHGTITQRGSGSKQCWCCMLKYHSGEGLIMKYVQDEDDDSDEDDDDEGKWMCTNCALNQRKNNKNKSNITIGTAAQLLELLCPLSSD